MKTNRILTTLVSMFMLGGIASAFGPLGHSTVASLANENLKPAVRNKVEAYLGHTIVFYSTWMDEWREDPVYKHTSSWHSFPVNAELNYTDELYNAEKGNSVWALENAIEVLKKHKEYDDSTVVANLKYVIHLVGDLHCPSHIKYADKDTKIKVYPYKGEKKLVSYHSIWDEQIISRRCEAMSPIDLGRDFNSLSKKEIKALQSGTIRDWAHENAVRCSYIYDIVKDGDTVYKPFYNSQWPLVVEQVTKGGYRLAGILNECFR